MAFSQPVRPALRLVTRSPRQTLDTGRRLGAAALPGDCLLLEGPLGAGKTVLCQGLAEGLSVEQPVVSPTFTLIHEHPGRLRLYHVDLYRLTEAETADLGLAEYLEAGGVTAIEWAERLPASGGRAGGLQAVISFGPEEDSRTLEFYPRDAAGARWLARLEDGR